MTRTALLDELGVAGIHEGFAPERLALAKLLEANGITPDDVAMLALHCRSTVDGEPGARRVLASILADPEKARVRLDDLRAIHALRAARQNRGFGDKPTTPGPTEGETKEAWEHDRMCRIAWCRTHGDRAPVELVAKELGVSETTLRIMVDRGRVLSTSPLLDGVEKPTRKMVAEGLGTAEEDERRKQFREMMRRAKETSGR